MAEAVQKITLSASRDIPFNKLVLSQSNVRRVKAGISIEELADDIARRTLLQGLSVRPVLDDNGQETGMFEVPAGGRRYRALELLVKQKRLARTALVPCVVRDAGSAVSADEDSLAENVQRVALHPLDQFRAFQALRDKGLGEEEIAARFFVPASVVKQRLRLTSVSEKLLEIYADDGMTLEQLMAFSVSNDHARQEQVWEGLSHSYNKEPYLIRRQLTEGAARGTDRRAQFVGIEAYESAGGIVMRDLFQQDDGGWLQDPALLDGLAIAKLQAEAERLREEGWKWIAVAVDFPYGHAHQLRKLAGIPAALTADEHATMASLKAEFDALEAQYSEADEISDEVDARFGEIETALAAFEQRPAAYDPAEVARAGAFVSIDAHGRLFVDRGYVRPEDEVRVTGDDDETDCAGGMPEPVASGSPAIQRAVITIGGDAEPEADDDNVIRPLPDRLVGELTAHRTLALRDALASQPHVAMTALLHKLCCDTFERGPSGACLEVSVRHVFFPVQAADLKDCPSATSVAERQAAWKAELPRDEAALWHYLDGLDEASRAALLAHCVSFGVNALFEKGDRFGGPGVSVHGVQQRLSEADRLARAVGLDMVEAGWRPTVENYLGRVTKPRILEAVREAKGEQAAQLIDHLKKGDMAKEAERLLDGTGWLPEPLRLADMQPVADGATGSVDALPVFLANDDKEAIDGQLPDAIAAE